MLRAIQFMNALVIRRITGQEWLKELSYCSPASIFSYIFRMSQQVVELPNRAKYLLQKNISLQFDLQSVQLSILL